MSATKSATKKQSPLSQQDALEILKSAVLYCRESGLTVRAGNRPQLVIAIDDVTLTPDGDFAVTNVTSLAEMP